MHKRNKSKKGFTLVELSLSVLFIALLSIAVAVIVTNSISSYHRGVILNQINTTGMEIVDDMRASIQSSPARSVKSECGSTYEESEISATVLKACEDDNGKNFVVVTKRAKVTLGSKELSSVPVYGAFCTGAYSYIWNSGYFYAGSDVKVQEGVSQAKLTYKKRGSTSPEEPMTGKLIKVLDENREVCIVGAGADYISGANNATNDFDMTKSGIGGVVDEDPFDLISEYSGLTIYNLTTDVPASSTSIDNMFYSVSFILGTSTGGINVMSNGDFCAPPGDASRDVEDFDYCAINKFNFAAEANGG